MPNFYVHLKNHTTKNSLSIMQNGEFNSDYGNVSLNVSIYIFFIILTSYWIKINVAHVLMCLQCFLVQ